jgi:hypothetical protein
LTVENYIHHIIINIHDDDDLMAENMTSLVGTPPPPKNVEQNILEYVDCKNGTIFLS